MTFDKSFLKNPAFWLATWMGSGMMKPAPGTWGSLAAIPIGLIVYKGAGLTGLLIATAVIFRLGVWAADELDRLMESKDNSIIVIDEVVGQWLSMLTALYLYGMSPLGIFLSFLFFRFFDILKPWPVSFFDRKIKGGLGVMLDDVAAGLYAAVCITGLYYAGFG